METLSTGARIAELLLTAPERSDNTLRLLEFKSDKTLLTERSLRELAADRAHIIHVREHAFADWCFGIL
jgi:hypothetical protein